MTVAAEGGGKHIKNVYAHKRPLLDSAERQRFRQKSSEDARMLHATITIHLPSHRRKSLISEGDTAEAVEAYDSNIGAYIKFLKNEAIKPGLALNTDEQDLDAAYSISAADHATKTAAHDWLHEQPDLWNWIP